MTIAGFDPSSYLAANIDLVRAGVTQGTAENHYVNSGRSEGRSTTFDSAGYLASNTDLLRAGVTTATAAQHYATSGYTENRSTSFNASSYLAANTDLIRAGLTTTTAAQHYVASGYTEHRSTSFDATSYLAANTDLIRAGLTSTTALQQYIRVGYTENRSTSFNASSYLAANTDLIRAGLTTTTVVQQYISVGYTENRSTSFNAASYMAANSDLTFTSAAQAAAHYATYGYLENRTTSFDFSNLDISAYFSTYSDLQSSFVSSEDRYRTALEHYETIGIFEGRRIVPIVPVVTGAVSLSPNGGSVGASISTRGERDVYALNLVAGTHYTFNEQGSGSGNGSLGDPYLRLFNSANQLVAQDDDTGTGTDSLIEYTPTRSGTYYLSAGAFADVGTGTYRVSVTAPTRTVIFPSTRGTIAYEGEQDEFTVSLSAGSRYQIDLEGSATEMGTLDDPYLRVLSSGGTRLNYDDDSGEGLNSQLVFSPASSGTYRLQASGYGSSRGSYTLSVSQIG